MLARLGCAADRIAAFLPPRAQDLSEQTFQVWPSNWEAALMFLDLDDQWLFSPMGRAMGIRFTSIQSSIAMNNVADTRGMLRKLKTMSRAAANALAEASK